MITVQLTKQEWDAVINCMGYAPGNMCVPLWNKMTVQIQQQDEKMQETPVAQGEISVKHNG